MLCDICQKTATGWCATCNGFACDDHGGQRCFRCAGAFVAVDQGQRTETETGIWTSDKDAAPSGKGYLQSYGKPSMPTVYIDDPGPPECYECGGIAKKICSQCQSLFCADHAGKTDTCKKCVKSSYFALITLLAVFAFIGVVLVIGIILY